MALFGVRQIGELVMLLRTAARVEIMPRFQRLEAGDIRAKSGPLDLVTDADEAAERLITAGLHEIFPGCAVVGEEAASADPSLLARLQSADLAFVVDPIDGTQNYAAGLPLFGVMAAAIVRGEIAGAVILDPIMGDSAVAVRGEGAWIETEAGRQRDLRAAAPVPLGRMTGTASFRNLPPQMQAAVARNLTKVAAAFDFRCAAHHYRMLASGTCHFSLANKLMPWDHAPGVLLHREAGGYSARFDGSPYLPTRTVGGLLCTPDEASFLELREALFAD
jgi:fructose-1,6-bisphosphatase/inositol monophosphatase family enzyme